MLLMPATKGASLEELQKRLVRQGFVHTGLRGCGTTPYKVGQTGNQQRTTVYFLNNIEGTNQGNEKL